MSCVVQRAAGTVHPHARGENASSDTQFVFQNGPPPRAWGKRLVRPGNAQDVRSTPRAWGKLDMRPPQRVIGRSTPTRVGKTMCLRILILHIAVHPHARGENGPGSCRPRRGFGPPPRAWGKLSASHSQPDQRRSTPTRVGKTLLGTRQVAACLLHPHARGENIRRFTSYCTISGPPPRAWGKRSTGKARSRYRRSTPTRVGKTKNEICCHCQQTVHPHARGENVTQKRDEFLEIRSTPTRVGKTLHRVITRQY